MSNLQIGLAIAGGLILAAVVAHGAWSSRRNAPRQALPEARHSGDSSASGPREPGLTEFENTQPINQPPAVRRLAMDPLIDVIATITIDAPHPVVSGEAAIAAMPSTRRAGTKPFAIEGHNLRTLNWEVPLAGQRYGSFQAGVQLANIFSIQLSWKGSAVGRTVKGASFCSSHLAALRGMPGAAQGEA